MQRKAKDALVLMSLFGVLIVVFAYIKDASLFADEYAHNAQVGKFFQGDFSLKPWLTTVPGFHYTVWFLGSVLSLSPGQDLRWITFGIGLGSVISVFFVARRLGRSLIKTVQFAFLPLVFPFLFLIYTDVLSLLLVVIAFGLALRRRHRLAGLVAMLSCLVRQNNILWVLFLFFWIYYEQHGFSASASKLLAHARSHWIYVLGVGLFTAFVIGNQGVALGDQRHHPVGLYTGNIFFFLLVFFFLFLPLNLYNLPAILGLLKRRPGVVGLGLAAMFGAYLTGFPGDHPFNAIKPEYFLRNGILQCLTNHPWFKALCFLPVAWSALSLAVTRLRKTSFYLLYPFTVLFLAPSWLVEQRYYMIPLTLFILFKAEQSERLELTTAGLFGLTSLVLMYFIERGDVFL